MNDNDCLDFVSAMGDEFADVLQSVSADVSGADVYSVVSAVSRARLSPALLASFRSEQIEQLRIGFVSYFEVANDAVTHEQSRRRSPAPSCVGQSTHPSMKTPNPAPYPDNFLSGSHPSTGGTDITLHIS